MALTDMKVFNEAVQDSTIETLAQMVQAFNAASRGAIQLTAEGFRGDYRQRSYWASLASAQRRVNRHNTATNQVATPLTQLEEDGVKIAGGFGPVLWEPSQLTWVQKNPTEAVAVISQSLAEAILQDQLNTAIKALVAALQVSSDSYVDVTTAPLDYKAMNRAHAKFGDASGTIVCNVMNGTAYHNLIDVNLSNAPTLFNAGNVTVVNILNRAVVVTDAPDLENNTNTSAPASKRHVLGLTAGAATVYDGSDLVTNVETKNGKTRIETTFQADYTFGLALRGYTWDTTSGGKSPDDGAIGTGAYWDRVATSVKHTAGVLAMANA